MNRQVKTIVREVLQEAFNESALNRVLSWMKQYDIACITAFRDEFKNSTPRTLDDRPQELIDADKKNGIENTMDKTPYKYFKKEKISRNRELKAMLLSLGYGVTNIRGNYIENYGTIDAVELGENSFFVVNLNNDSNFKKNIFELSEYYNQDCFLFKPKGSDVAYNIGTNYGEYPGYGNEDNLGTLHINIDNEFLSRVGNASFAFTNNESPKQDNREYNFQSRKQDRINNLKEALGLDVYGNYSRGARMSIKSICEKVEKHLTELNENTKHIIDEASINAKKRNVDNVKSALKYGKGGGYNAIKTFAVFTAENPDSQEATDKYNRKVNKSLAKALKDNGYVCLPAKGKFGETPLSANIEHPFIVLNISLESCKAFCGYYQQTSFIYHKLEDGKFIAQYWEKEDTEEPYNKKSNDYVLKDEEENIVDNFNMDSDDMNYTEIGSGVGKNYRYSIPFSIFNEVNQHINENLERMVAYRKEKYNDNRDKEQYLEQANRIGIYENKLEKPINACMRKAINRGLL